ncbi:heme utilization protein HutZ [Enterovibrio nigricans]|uniref:Pyridoxamine 5'-phosphate oxidase N-terminal domain-containing protein n=1 Tax=Enterovibrio nigricans DSM 22720 TaxID=1121868 RepID=A0A1T4V5F5_9GAMM|nr:heme utilization protein HutZ [Enterovibrio nigricans]PKF50391.1 heme utilization protein HutZ [Enterovibrio nigricans]SKA60082.1 hypothetical protein SAMN02745132_03232 [Enterovibrio nigricans DSM 22720]
MIDKAERLQNRLGPEIQEFRDSRNTLQLGTVDKEGKPHTSYAPFAFSEMGYYILVSDLATHGQNLKNSKAVSIMMIEDESEARSIFARRRLSFDTNAEHIERDSEQWVAAIEVMQARLGEMIENLSSLGDFNLYRLNPVMGRYVKGFGQAFNVSGEDMLSVMYLDEGHVKQMKEDNAK